ncbi:MAG: TetR/AcrR family transcriptional regulator [Sumerlaeia bacterium]
MVQQQPQEKKNTKLTLLLAGTAVMTRKSYNGAGLTEILAEAGVPKGSFYHHFQSKEDFGVQIVEHHALESGQVLKNYFQDSTLTPVNRIKSWFQYIQEHYQENGPQHQCLIAKLALELSTLSAPMHTAVKFAYDHWTMIFAEVLKEAQACREIPNHIGAEKLAMHIVNGWQGVTIRMQIDESLEPLDNYLDVLFTVIFQQPIPQTTTTTTLHH